MASPFPHDYVPPAPGAGTIDPARAAAARQRIRNLNLLSFAFAIPGIAAQAVGRVMLTTVSEDPQTLDEAGKALAGAGLTLGGAAFLIIGLCFYARMKGRSWAFGLLGFLSCIGLLILAVLGKKCGFCGSDAPRSATECGRCRGPV
ncbi:MAG: hypothetical protein HUU15_14940 [Candidatus Brocadiae bacterium]|nr:hypothetical protein [Candidatus Brocadiia bacterium]